MKICVEKNLTRVVCAIGDFNLTIDQIKHFAAAGGRKVEHLSIGKRQNIPYVEFCMASITDALKLGGTLRRDIAWKGCKIVYRADPCAISRGIRYATGDH